MEEINRGCMKYCYILFVVFLTVFTLIDIWKNPIRKEIQQTNIDQCKERRSIVISGKVIIPVKHDTCNDSN